MLPLPRLLIASTIVALTSFPAVAQTSAPDGSPVPERRTMAGPATSTTVDGFIHGVTSERGTHVTVDSVKGTVDINAGPWIAPDLKTALVSGKNIHVTGLTQTVNGKDLVLAQQITINGQTWTVRNANGIPSRPRAVARNGGAR
jgi:hypothetical protein